MIRRTAVYANPDQRVVKVALVAAAFALTLGYFAEHRLATREESAATTVADQSVEVRPAKATRETS